MVMTRSTGSGATEVETVAPARTVARPAGVPGARAVLGGVLVALSGLATFMMWARATGTPEHAYAVAAGTLDPGDPVGPDEVRWVRMDLPAGVAGAAFGDAAELEGRVALAPIAEGELIQAASLSDQGGHDPTAELSVALARERAVNGRLRSGDLVDVYATTQDGGTQLVAEGIRVLDVSEAAGAFDGGGDLTVTLGVSRSEEQVAIVDAASHDAITLIRTTHVGRRSPPASAGEAAGGTAT
jgi:Flp pilus assembly protein CpaB